MSDFDNRVKWLRERKEAGWYNEMTVDEQIIVHLADQVDVLRDTETELRHKKRTFPVAQLMPEHVGKKLRVSGDEITFSGWLVAFTVPQSDEELFGAYAAPAEIVQISFRGPTRSFEHREQTIYMELTDTVELLDD